MNENIKALWTAALRSGDYEQGQGVLSGNGKFCCLGVLCEIAVKEGFIPEPVDNSLEEKMYGFPGERQAVTLPNSITEWAGLTDAGGRFDGPAVKHYNTLWELNDSAGMSFSEIADLIDEKF